jgi:hypothetical protein
MMKSCCVIGIAKATNLGFLPTNSPAYSTPQFRAKRKLLVGQRRGLGKKDTFPAESADFCTSVRDFRAEFGNKTMSPGVLKIAAQSKLKLCSGMLDRFS